MNTPPTIPANPATPEETRKAYLTHEASTRSIGLLYFLGAIGCLIYAASVLIVQGPAPEGIATAVILIVLGGFQFWVGRKLQQLDPVAKIPATVLSAIGLIAFPLGTLINAYVLYLLHSAKGKVVFSPEYQAVVAATPHLKYKTSLLVWLLLGLLVLLLLVVLFGAFAAQR